MLPEGKVKQQIKKILDDFHVYYFMPHGGMYGNIGVPDFICCSHGVFIGIEAKAKNNKPSPRQVKHLKAIAEHGGISLVLNEHNVQELRSILTLLHTS